MNTTKRIKRRAVLVSGSVSLFGYVSAFTALHRLLSMSRDVTYTLEKRCPLDKYEYSLVHNMTPMLSRASNFKETVSTSAASFDVDVGINIVNQA